MLKSEAMCSTYTEADGATGAVELTDVSDGRHVNTKESYPRVVRKEKQRTWEIQPRHRRILSQAAGLAVPSSYFTALDAALAITKCDSAPIQPLHHFVSHGAGLGLCRFVKLQQRCISQDPVRFVSEIVTYPSSCARLLPHHHV